MVLAFSRIGPTTPVELGVRFTTWLFRQVISRWNLSLRYVGKPPYGARTTRQSLGIFTQWSANGNDETGAARKQIFGGGARQILKLM